MSRKPLIAGNWKMNLTVSEGMDLAKALCVANIDYKSRDVLVAPSFIVVCPVFHAIEKCNGKVLVAAQNMYFEESGAYTGEVSAEMIKSAGASYVILGHSERRTIFNECDCLINKKVKKALSSGLKVILCVGETLAERQALAHEEVVLAQTGKCLADVDDLTNVAIAYEPVWAIGTGKTATSADAEAMHKAIREYIAKIRGKDAADKVRILYGGSVKGENAKELLNMPNIDGALVGGASLKADKFLDIINFDK